MADKKSGEIVKASVLQDVETLRVLGVDKPVPLEGECLIRIRLAGVCGSDSSLFRGKVHVPLPVIPGHEAVATVEAAGSADSKFRPGDRVVLHPNIACGSCPTCRKGLPNICLNKQRVGLDRNGIFAEFATVPESYLYHVPESLPDEVAVFAEPLAVAVHGTSFQKPSAADKVLVFGAGVIGLLTMQLALMSARDVVACDLSKSRLELARKLGASDVGCSEELKGKYSSSFDIVFETSGAPAGLDEAIDLVAPGGTIVLFGLPSGSHPVRTDVIVRKQLKILGSIIYVDEFPDVIKLLGTGRIDTASLISETINLEDLEASLRNFYQPDRIKTLVKIV